MARLRQAAQQALEALELAHMDSPTALESDAIYALRAALEQPEQEPVAWNSVGATSLEFETECLDGTRFLNVVEMPSHAVRWRIVAPPRRTGLPHRSHLCHGCGHIWRPADVPTNGVVATKTKGKADSITALKQPDHSVDANKRVQHIPAEESDAEFQRQVEDTMCKHLVIKPPQPEPPASPTPPPGAHP